MDWSNNELKVCVSDTTTLVKGKLSLAEYSKIETLSLQASGNNFELINNPLANKVTFKISK
jgi:hypothetical protein